MRWDVDPAAVRGVIQRTEGMVSCFDDGMRTVNAEADHIEGLAACAPEVARAWQWARQGLGADHAGASAHAGTVTGAANTALEAYEQGDQEMVLNAQRQAAAAHDPRAYLPSRVRS